MLQLKNTPGLSGDYLVMTHPQDKQVGQHGDAYGFLTAVFVPADLVLAQPQARFQVPVHQLDRPTFLVDAHDLARCQLGQIGHQDFGMLGAQVTPFFTQDHSDIAYMTQTQAGAIRPKRFATFPPRRSGNPDTLVILVRHMGHEIFERFILNGLPGPGDRKDKAPAACGIGLVTGFDHVHIGLGTIGSITAYGSKANMDMVKRSEEHTSELQSLAYLVCRLLLEKKKKA